MPSFIRPAGNVPVSSSWQAHKNRIPPSQEPGTDYACAAGTVFVAPEAGVIRGLRTTPATAAGRYVLIRFDTGDWGRGLHLRTVDVKVGQKVTRGQKLGTTGGSANNSETGVPPHIHWSWWPGRGNNAPAIASTPTADFEAYLAKQAAPAPAKPATAPAFPLPAGHYFGPHGGPKTSHSGYASAADRAALRRFQQRLKDRGWKITVDGLYGKRGAKTPAGNTADIVYAFQKEKRLKADKLIGKDTWNAAWTAPVT